MDSNTKITPGLQALLDGCREAFIMAGADANLADIVGHHLNQLPVSELTFYFVKLVQFGTPVVITGLTAALEPRHSCELFLRNHLIPVLLQDEEVLTKFEASPYADSLPIKRVA